METAVKNEGENQVLYTYSEVMMKFLSYLEFYVNALI